MNVKEVFISWTNGKKLINIAAWSQDDYALFSDKNKTIYDNLSFNRTPYNKILENRSIN